MDGLWEIIVLISLLFMIAIYVQFWMVKKQVDRIDSIVCQFHTMFSNAYEVISEEELTHIMKHTDPVKDNGDIIKEWDEGN